MTVQVAYSSSAVASAILIDTQYLVSPMICHVDVLVRVRESRPYCSCTRIPSFLAIKNRMRMMKDSELEDVCLW